MILGKCAVYNANSRLSAPKYHGCNFTFSSTNGAFWITEWTLLVNQEKTDTGLAGNYKVGFYYQTRTPTFSGEVGGDPGYYFLFDQELAKGITPFVAMLFQPKDRNLFPFFFMAGLVYDGIIPSRPKDALALGMAYGKYSQDLDTEQNFEAVLELNYTFQMSAWCQLTPDMQLILHPRGKEIPSAFCLGFQLAFLL